MGVETSPVTTMTPNLELLDAARELKNVPWCEEYEAMISGMPYVWNLPTTHLTCLSFQPASGV